MVSITNQKRKQVQSALDIVNKAIRELDDLTRAPDIIQDDLEVASQYLNLVLDNRMNPSKKVA